MIQSFQTWHRGYLGISYKWYGFELKGQRSTSGLRLTAIQCGLELYERLLVVAVMRVCLNRIFTDLWRVVTPSSFLFLFIYLLLLMYEVNKWWRWWSQRCCCCCWRWCWSKCLDIFSASVCLCSINCNNPSVTASTCNYASCYFLTFWWSLFAGVYLPSRVLSFRVVSLSCSVVPPTVQQQECVQRLQVLHCIDRVQCKWLWRTSAHFTDHLKLCTVPVRYGLQWPEWWQTADYRILTTLIQKQPLTTGCDNKRP